MGNPLYFELTSDMWNYRDPYYPDSLDVYWNYLSSLTFINLSYNTEVVKYTGEDIANTLHPTSSHEFIVTKPRTDNFNTRNIGVVLINSRNGGNSFDADPFTFINPNEEITTLGNYWNDYHHSNYVVTYNRTGPIRELVNDWPCSYTIGILYDIYNGKLKVYQKQFSSTGIMGDYPKDCGDFIDRLDACLIVDYDIPKSTRIELNTIPYNMRLQCSVWSNYTDEDLIDAEGNPREYAQKLEFNFGQSEWKIPILARYLNKH